MKKHKNRKHIPEKYKTFKVWDCIDKEAQSVTPAIGKTLIMFNNFNIKYYGGETGRYLEMIEQS